MPKYGFSITKAVSWRGSPERFANVYHFDSPTALSAEVAQSILGRLAAVEKAVHCNMVTWREGRCWEVGGTPTENETIVIIDLSGTGALPMGNGDMSGEGCYLVQFRTGRPSETGRPVTLKKWLRTGATIGGDTQTTVSNRAQVSQAARDLLLGYANNLMPLVTAGAPDLLLAAPSSNRVAESAFVFPWIEHHELEY